MPFELALTLSFAMPALVALLMPGFRSLAIYTVLMVVGVGVGLRCFEATIDESNDGPDSALFAGLFVVAFVGAGVGAFVRLGMLLLQRSLQPGPPKQQN